MNRVVKLSSIMIKASKAATTRSLYPSMSMVPSLSVQLNQTPSYYYSSRQSSSSSSTRRIRRRKDSEGLLVENTSQGGESITDDNDSMAMRRNVNAVKDKVKFLDASHAFLTKTATALEPMKAYNDVFNVQRSTNDKGEILTLSLKPSEGQYVLQVDNDLLTLSLRSPMSGNYTYVLCKNTHKFVGMEDAHAIEGMIVRDLIRHCNGLPNF